MSDSPDLEERLAEFERKKRMQCIQTVFAACFLGFSIGSSVALRHSMGKRIAPERKHRGAIFGGFFFAMLLGSVSSSRC
jgi:hypothetical protein